MWLKALFSQVALEGQGDFLFLFRHSLAHVVGAVEGYVAHMVLEGGWQRFQRRVEALIAGNVGLWREEAGRERVDAPAPGQASPSAAQGDLVGLLREEHDRYTAELLEHSFLPPTASSCGRSSSAMRSANTTAHALLVALLDTALDFCSIVRVALHEGSRELIARLPGDVQVLSRRFKATLRGLIGGLKAVTQGGHGFQERVCDLLSRLGPLEFLK